MTSRNRATSARHGARLCLLALGLTAACHAADEQALALTLNCAACHTQHHTQPATPAINGLTEEQLRSRLLDFKHDRQQVTLMNRIAKAYSDDELAAIAACLARRPSHAQP